MRIRVLTWFILLLSAGTYLQAQECFLRFFNEGKAAYENLDFETALKKFEAARICSDASTTQLSEAEGWLSRTKDDRINALRKEKDRALALALSAKSILASQQQKDATLALRYAQYALQKADIGESRQALYAAAWQDLLPLSREVRGHQREVFEMAVSPDGSYFLTSSFDHVVKRWDLSGNFLGMLRDTFPGMQYLLIDPSGERIISYSNDLLPSDEHIVRIWDKGGKLLSELIHENSISAVQLSPGGNSLLTASKDGHLRIWAIGIKNKPAGTALFHWEASDPFEDALFSPDGSYVLAQTGSQAEIWQFRENRFFSLQGSEGAIKHLACSRDGNTLALAYAEGMIRTYNRQGEPLALLDLFEGEFYKVRPEIRSLEFSADGQYLLSAFKSRVLVWKIDTQPAKPELVAYLDHDNPIQFARFSPRDNLIFTVTDDFWNADYSIRVWGNLDFKENEKPFPFMATLTSELGSINDFRFSPEGDALLAAGEKGAGLLWDLQPAHFGQQLAYLGGHKGNIEVVCFVPGSLALLTASYDHTARIWYYGQPLFNRLMTQGKLKAFTATPDLTYWVTSSWNEPFARVWQLADAEFSPLAKLEKEPDAFNPAQRDENEISTLAISPDGKLVATSVDEGIFTGSDFVYASTISLWNPRGQLLATIKDLKDQVLKLSFSPDNKYLLLQMDYLGELQLWEVKSNPKSPRLAASLCRDENGISHAAFTSDGTYVVAAFHRGVAKVFRCATGEEVLTLEGHEADLDWAEVSPDSRYVVTASRDKTAAVWDFNGKRLFSLEHQGFLKHFGFVRKASFLPDMQHLLTSTDDSTFIWSINMEENRANKTRTLTGGNASFTPDGRFILTESRSEMEALIWDLEGNLLATLGDAQNRINTVWFSENGDFLVTGWGGKEIRIWPFSPEIIFSKMEGFNPTDLPEKEKQKFEVGETAEKP